MQTFDQSLLEHLRRGSRRAARRARGVDEPARPPADDRAVHDAAGVRAAGRDRPVAAADQIGFSWPPDTRMSGRDRCPAASGALFRTGTPLRSSCRDASRGRASRLPRSAAACATPSSTGSGAESDIDIATDARPDVIEQAVKGWADAVWLQGERFGTVGCQKGDDRFEITTFRAEIYRSDSRKPGGHVLRRHRNRSVAARLHDQRDRDRARRARPHRSARRSRRSCRPAPAHAALAGDLVR